MESTMSNEPFFIAINDMSADEVLATVTKVVDKIAPKYTFFGYEVDDIKQESYLICRDGLLRYNSGEGPLENFLSVHLPYRLINLIRKMHMSKTANEDKQKIYKPAQLEEGFNQDDSALYSDYEHLDYGEMVRIINRELPASMRRDWLKMANDAPVSKVRDREIREIVREIVEEHGYCEENDECDGDDYDEDEE